MAHESVINAFINVGLRQKELQNVLASNVVLDWFGRTLSGKQKVIDFYLNSNNSYEHSLSNVETAQPFENRSTHLITRKEPEENFNSSMEISSDEQWYDCEANSSIDVKDQLKTPPKKSTPAIDCPPAPCRRILINNSSDEETESDPDDGFELGICPLDPATNELFKSKKVKSDRGVKRQRLNREKAVNEYTTILDERESKYSELYYLETTGSVMTNRQQQFPRMAEDNDRRECKLLISYRVKKHDQNDIQIALIVYKPNNSNLKTRRNLLGEFDDEIESGITPVTPSTSRFNTAVKEQPPKRFEDVPGISTAPAAGSKSTKGTKRPIMSRNRLRF